jgi:hypothetical protein
VPFITYIKCKVYYILRPSKVVELLPLLLPPPLPYQPYLPRPLVPRRPRRLTASSPLLTDDNTKLGDQDDSTSREPPLAD